MKRICLFWCVLFVVAGVPALADPPDVEYKFTADGGFRFASLTAVGPALVEALADGEATIYLIDSTDGAGTDPNGRKRKWPGDDFGLGYYELRANIARPFSTFGTNVDSCYVDLVTATEVIVSCTN